jgi:hypothetical protein
VSGFGVRAALKLCPSFSLQIHLRGLLQKCEEIVCWSALRIYTRAPSRRVGRRDHRKTTMLLWALMASPEVSTSSLKMIPVVSIDDCH